MRERIAVIDRVNMEGLFREALLVYTARTE
jgi:hypothetical protein